MIATGRPAAQRPISVYAVPTAAGLGAAGLCALLAGLVDLTDGAADAATFAFVGLASMGLGLGLIRIFRPPARYRAMQALTSITATLVTMVLVGAVALAGTDAFADLDGSRRVTDAVFESASGFTTTGMTTLPVVQDAGRGVLFFRAASNWVGGLAALIAGVVVLPFVTRTRDLIETDHHHEAARNLAPSIRIGARNVFRFYAAFTGMMAVAFVLTGIGLFDGVAYALAVVSTGGFATHNASLWSEGSPAAEWVAIGGMFVAGTNVAVIWWALRGAVRPIRRSLELRLYVAYVVAAVLVVNVGIGGFDDIAWSREAVFAVASTVSTTGLVAFDWWSWGAGAQVVLVILLAIGPMSRSSAGGMRLIRLVVLWEVARRELVRMVYPRAVHVVKIGGRPLSDDTVRTVAGFLVLYAGLILAGAYVIGLFEDGLRLTLVASVSAVSTTGLLLGVHTAAELTEGARIALIPLMVAGRLAILPLFVSVERAAAVMAHGGRSVYRRIGR